MGRIPPTAQTLSVEQGTAPRERVPLFFFDLSFALDDNAAADGL